MYFVYIHARAWSSELDSEYLRNFLKSVTKRKAGLDWDQGSLTVQFTSAEFLSPIQFEVKATALTHLWNLTDHLLFSSKFITNIYRDR